MNGYPRHKNWPVLAEYVKFCVSSILSHLDSLYGFHKVGNETACRLLPECVKARQSNGDTWHLAPSSILRDRNGNQLLHVVVHDTMATFPLHLISQCKRTDARIGTGECKCCHMRGTTHCQTLTKTHEREWITKLYHKCHKTISKDS